MRQAKLLLQLAQAEGKHDQPETYFGIAAKTRESVFSTPEVAHEIELAKPLQDAETYYYRGHLPVQHLHRMKPARALRLPGN